MDHQIYLGLGSNLGDREANLDAARQVLPPAVSLERCSPIYQTSPWGYADQPDFLNQVVGGLTALPPQDLLATLKTIEKTLGRRPSFQYGPRRIDIDILLYGDWVLDTDGLQIPHPHLHERAFVLVPLCDLVPNLLHPVSHRRMADLLAEIDRTGVTLYQDDPCA
jgi:2-amino-4-hydroxy-6-hydroxymethyldihydropteridine diphosphokinase